MEPQSEKEFIVDVALYQGQYSVHIAATSSAESNGTIQDLKVRIDEMMSFLNDLPCELTEYEEHYVRTLVEKVTVYDDHIIVEFKSGIEIQIDE